jgi:hypothetical protein
MSAATATATAPPKSSQACYVCVEHNLPSLRLLEIRQGKTVSALVALVIILGDEQCVLSFDLGLVRARRGSADIFSMDVLIEGDIPYLTEDQFAQVEARFAQGLYGTLFEYEESFQSTTRMYFQ